MRSQSYGVVAALLLAALACSPNGRAADAPRKVSFRMEWIPSGVYTPFYYGMDAGIFRKHGIELDMLNGNGSLTTIDDVNSGHSDLGMSQCAGLALAIGNGRPMISVGQYTAKFSMAFYVPKDSGIASIGDMAGKSLVMSPNSADGPLLPALFKLVGVDPATLKRVLVDPSQKLTMYGRGAGDAVTTTVPYGDPLVQEIRSSRALKWADVGFVMPDLCIAARTETAKADPKFIQEFLDAVRESVAAARSNPDAAVAATVKLRPLTTKEMVARQWEVTQDFISSDDTGKCRVGWHSAADWRVGLETMQRYLDLKGDISQPEGRFFTNDFSPC